MLSKKNKVNIIPDKYKFAYGHRAAYSLINDSKYNYFTFLRDPYLTLISHFNHISRSILGFYPENHFINIRILKKDINSYIKEYKFKSYDNPFIRWLGGFYDVEFGKTNDFHLEKNNKNN